MGVCARMCVRVFVQQMPQDYHFDSQDLVWRTEDMEVEIGPGCGVRMRVVGVDITPGRMVSRPTLHM
jgi:DNA-directed RNA polymerase subunit E'/Rpb7